MVNLAVFGLQLDSMILEIVSDLNGSMEKAHLQNTNIRSVCSGGDQHVLVLAKNQHHN